MIQRGDLLVTNSNIITIVTSNITHKPIYDVIGQMYPTEADSPIWRIFSKDIHATWKHANYIYSNKFNKPLILPQWVATIMNTTTIQTPITPPYVSSVNGIPSTSTPPPTGYPIGTVLHGTNTRIGNLWIITLDNSYQASLLYDGRTFITTPDSSYKRDTMRPGMRIATSAEILAKTGLGGLPSWAQAFYFGSGQHTKAYLFGAPTSSGFRPVYGLIQKDLGLQPKQADDTAKPVDTCTHEYKPYYGLTESYDYCIHCDRKRSMLK